MERVHRACELVGSSDGERPRSPCKLGPHQASLLYRISKFRARLHVVLMMSRRASQSSMGVEITSHAMKDLNFSTRNASFITNYKQKSSMADTGLFNWLPCPNRPFCGERATTFKITCSCSSVTPVSWNRVSYQSTAKSMHVCLLLISESFGTFPEQTVRRFFCVSCRRASSPTNQQRRYLR